MQIYYLHSFLEEYESLDRGVQKQIRTKLQELSRTEFDQHSHLALKGPQFKGLYKSRAGDWRLIYKIVNREIFFITLGHRSEVYDG